MQQVLKQIYGEFGAHASYHGRAGGGRGGYFCAFLGIFLYIFGPREYYQSIYLVESSRKQSEKLKLMIFWLFIFLGFLKIIFGVLGDVRHVISMSRQVISMSRQV